MNNNNAPTDQIPQFRSFTDNDWGGWAGVEGSDPQIAQGENYELVLDGASVNVALEGEENEAGDEVAFLYACEFGSPAIASAIALSIRFNPEPDALFLFQLLGEPVGEL